MVVVCRNNKNVPRTRLGCRSGFGEAALKHIVVSIIFVLSAVTIARSDDGFFSRFTTDGLTGWETKSFKGETEYTIASEGGRTVVRAHSRGTASALFRRVRLAPARFRYLDWSWKIERTIEKGDETTRAGDDYAARIYVVFPGRFFWQTRAIAYIWANRLPKEEAIPSPFSGRVMMLVVESGSARAGEWINEQRDILADYRRLFANEPRDIGAIAIMTDSDNTGGAATAWYGDISLTSSRQSNSHPPP